MHRFFDRAGRAGGSGHTGRLHCPGRGHRTDRDAQIHLRVGVNTGEVVVAEGDLDVVGDAVNVAARLEHAAGPDTILVGEETFRLARASMAFEPAGKLDLHGKAEPVMAYRLVAADRPSVAATTAFVGREAELQTLLAEFDAAVTTRTARLVSIIGSPGVGKSRLVSELVRTLETRAAVVAARCDAGPSSTFEPLADAIRSIAGIPEGADSASAEASLTALLPSHEPDAARVVELVVALLGAGGAGTPEEMFWAVRRLAEHAARPRPLVVILDDAHWAKPMLLDLIEHLAEWAHDAPILMVLIARPELRETRPVLAERGGRVAACVMLEGLGDTAAAALATAVLGDGSLPAALIGRVAATCEGNPLFVREFVLMLVEDGIVVRSDDGWTATVPVDQVEVPATIHALLATRIERLRPDERAVAERAAVVGKQFYPGAVRDLLPAPSRPEMDGHLETLRRKELVDSEGTYWIDEPVFRFHHVLIRDAAYRRLLKEARAELHERFADWLERKLGHVLGDYTEVIGYHLEQAQGYRRELGPLDEAGKALGIRAGAHLGGAAGRALERDDLSAAADLAARALVLTAEDRAALLILRCEALLDLGDADAAGQSLDQLKAEACDERVAAWADALEAGIADLSGTGVQHGLALAASAVERLQRVNDLVGVARAYAIEASLLSRVGQIAKAEVSLDRALISARQVGDRRRANAVLGAAPAAALWGPSPVPRASGRCLDVIRILRITKGPPAVEAVALRCQAALEAMRGRADAARNLIGSARAKLEELGHRRALLETEVYAGMVELHAGQPAAAESLLRPAFEGLSAAGMSADAAFAATLLGRATLTLGRDDEALALSVVSERTAEGDLNAVAWRALRARVLASRGEIEEAMALAEQAVSIASRTDSLVTQAEAHDTRGVVLRAANRDEHAQAELLLARDLYDLKGATALGELPSSALGQNGRVLGGIRSYDPSEGAQGWVDRLTPWLRAFTGGDWVALADSYAPDHHYRDHRPGLRHEFADRDALIASWAETLSGATWRADLVILSATEVAMLARWSSAVGPTTGEMTERAFFFVAAANVLGLMATTDVFGLDQERLARDHFIAVDSPSQGT